MRAIKTQNTRTKKMKTFYTMYVAGYPVGGYRLTKTGSHFYFRKWRSLDRALNFIKFCCIGKETVLEQWCGEDCVRRTEYNIKPVQ